MAGRMQNIADLFSNMRTRTILFATGGILVLVVIIGYLGFSTKTTTQQNQVATVRTTRNIESVPGLSEATPEYADVQQNLNEQNYKAAVKQHGSSIPTVIGQKKNDTKKTNLNFPGESTQNQAKSTTRRANTTKADDADAPTSKLSKSELQKLLKHQQSQLEALKQQNQQTNQDDTQQIQQQVDDTQQAMQNQAQQLMASWAGAQGAATQTYVAGAQETTKTQKTKGTASSNGANNTVTDNNESTENNTASEPIIKTGDIMFAVLNTEVNSDEPGPVMATIVQGPLKGGKLVGSIQQTKSLPGTNGPTRIILNFNTLSLPSKANSLSISAVGIDPDTARTALASNVDHHYLERYGSLFASAFLEGYGNAIQQSGSTVTNSIFGGSTQTYQDLSGIEEVTAGLGQVGQEWGNQLGDVLDRPNTIIVHSGVGLGILFLNDVSLNQQGAVNSNQLPQNAVETSINRNQQTVQRPVVQQPNIATLPTATR